MSDIFQALVPLWLMIQQHARATNQDPHTIAAIVHVESRAQARAIKHETNGSCSVGLMGINVPGCDEVAVTHLLSPDANVRAGSLILKAGRAFCAAHKADNAACKRGGAVALYNPGDKAYAARVAAVRRKLRARLKLGR